MHPDIYPIAYAHGEFISWNQVQISPLDRGFLFGEGLYATIAVMRSTPLFCSQHLERLSAACYELGFPTPSENWQYIVDKIIALNSLDSAGISLIVTRGVDKSRNHLPTAQKPTVIAFAYPWKASAKKRPITADLQPDPRSPFYAHLKMNSLLPNVQASQKAHHAGFDKVIFHRDGLIVEAAQANLFWVRAGELYTPSAELPMVCGITRRMVFDIAVELGLTVHQGHYPIEVLKHAEEAFLCASLSQITPIKQIGSWEYPFDNQLTAKIAEMGQLYYEKEVTRQQQRYAEKDRV